MACRRFGAASPAVLFGVCVSVFVVGVTTVLVGPRVLLATQGDAETERDVQPLREPAAGLVRLISQSRAVLAIHDRQPHAPFTEIVLWMSDGDDPGHVNRHEILVLSHSRIMQTVTARYFDEHPPEGGRQRGRDSFDPSERMGEAYLSSRALCDEWRGHPSVRTRVIATGVSAMSFQIERGDSDLTSNLRIGLTCRFEQDDEPERILADVIVAVRRPIRKE